MVIHTQLHRDMLMKFHFCPHYWSNQYFTLSSYQTHEISQKWLCLLQVLLALCVLNRIRGINWTCTQHDALFTNLKHITVQWSIWFCDKQKNIWKSEYQDFWTELQKLCRHLCVKMCVFWVVMQCHWARSSCHSEASSQKVLLGLIALEDATITHNIGHHSYSDKVSTSQKTWVLKSTTVRSSNFTYYWKPFVSYLIPSFYRTKHIIWRTWKTLRILDTYYGFWVVRSGRWGTQWCSRFKHFATSLNVTEFVIDLILLDNILALGLTLPLTEMSTRDVSWGLKAASA
jgi:hypothetical protein